MTSQMGVGFFCFFLLKKTNSGDRSNPIEQNVIWFLFLEFQNKLYIVNWVAIGRIYPPILLFLVGSWGYEA